MLVDLRIIQSFDREARAGGKLGVFFVDSFGAGIIKTAEAHFLGETADDFGIGQSFAGRVDDFVQVTDPAFGIGHGAFFFCPGGCRQNDIGIG